MATEKTQPSQQTNPTKDNWLVLFCNEPISGKPSEIRIVKNTPFVHVEGWAQSQVQKFDYKFYQIFSTEVLKVPENTVTIKVTYEAV